MTFEESVRQDMRMKNDYELDRIQSGRTQDPGLAESLSDPAYGQTVKDVAQDELARREEHRMAIAEQDRLDELADQIGLEGQYGSDTLSDDPLINNDDIGSAAYALGESNDLSVGENYDLSNTNSGDSDTGDDSSSGSDTSSSSSSSSSGSSSNSSSGGFLSWLLGG